MSKAAVVILNYNGRKYLEQFLPCVLAHSPSWAKIIVADNASTDDSVDFLKKHFPQVRIIQNAENGGFAKGYNDALSHVDAEYFVLLNSDIEVPENWLEPCIALLEQHPEAAACQPKIRAFHQKDEFEYAGAAGGFIDKWGFPFCRGRIFDTYEKDNGQYNDDCEVFWATGACLVIRSSAWKAAEGFDADFFAHMEEIDLCWRLRNMGWKILYSGQSHIYHVGGGTLNKLSPRKTFLNFRNNLILIAKNHAPGWFFIKIFLRLCIDGVAGIRFLFSGDAAHCFAVLKAHFSFYATLGTTLRKRKVLKARIGKWATGGVYNGSIVWEYFAGGKKKYTQLDKSKFS